MTTWGNKTSLQPWMLKKVEYKWAGDWKKRKEIALYPIFLLPTITFQLVDFWAEWATWQLLQGKATERPLRTRCPQPDFKGSLAAANSAQKLLPVSGLLLHDNNYEDNIPGRMFPDIKKKKTNIWASSYFIRGFSAGDDLRPTCFCWKPKGISKIPF